MIGVSPIKCLIVICQINGFKKEKILKMETNIKNQVAKSAVIALEKTKMPISSLKANFNLR